MKVDENVHGATCISDAVFMQMMITLINHGNSILYQYIILQGGDTFLQPCPWLDPIPWFLFPCLQSHLLISFVHHTNSTNIVLTYLKPHDEKTN